MKNNDKEISEYLKRNIPKIKEVLLSNVDSNNDESKKMYKKLIRIENSLHEMDEDNSKKVDDKCK